MPNQVKNPDSILGRSDTRRFVQERFAIGFWVDPPAEEDMDARYKEIAAANFTLVLGGFGARTPEMVEKQITLCEKYGLTAVVSMAGLPPDKLPEGPACWGYMLRDEPNVKDFPELKNLVNQIREARPERLSYINLYPNYANEQQLGTSSYEEYVKQFVDEVDVDVLSMDHYPLMRPDIDNRLRYCDNLEVMRKYSLLKKMPFWNFFNVSSPTTKRLMDAFRSPL